MRMKMTFRRSPALRETGAVSIEYALIASLISIIIYASLQSSGTTLNNSYYQKVSQGLKSENDQK